MGTRQLIQLVRDHRISPDSIQTSLNQISQFMLRNSRCLRHPNFHSVAEEDLGLLFHITDETFFDGLVGQAVENMAAPLSFRLSKRMTTTGGMTTQQKSESRRFGKRRRQTTYEIAIATNPLFKSFTSQSTAKVAGLSCNSRLEALQRIMQHEMIHLVEMLIWDDSNCHRSRFKSIARRMFGHLESNHQLATPREYGAKQFGVRTGQWVWFRLGGVERRGFVNRITKRATVLVPSAEGTLYDDGTRYQRFYVPLNKLRPAAAKAA